MTTEARVLARPCPWSRVAGLGTIYGKTLRDSWRAALLVGGIASLFMIGTGAPYGFAPEFSTIELRRIFVAGLTSLPLALRGLLGEPINLDTMGGFLSWRVGNTLPVLLGLWPVIALSGTLAGEAAKGSLDLLASTPQARRTIAIEKLAGHVTAVILAMLLLAFTIWFVGAAFGSLPGDEIPVSAALGQVALYGVMMLSVGGVAFATAPWLGRTRAMAFGLIVLFASYLIYSYATLSPVVDVAQAAVVLRLDRGPPADGGRQRLAVRRGVGCHHDRAVRGRRRRASSDATWGAWRTSAGSDSPSLPAGITGPFTRQLADRTGIALAWGAGIGLYGALIVASAEAFSDMITNLPQIAALIEAIYPDLDLTQPSAVLQLTFFGFGSFIIGLAGASFLAGWATDEGRRRLEVVLSTPRSRASWSMRSGLGVMAAIGVVTVVIALIIGVATAIAGGTIVDPVVGIGILGLAAAGFAGVGLAVGGLVRVVAGGRRDRCPDRRHAAARHARRGPQAAPVGA